MNAKEATAKMVDATGRSMREISAELGKHGNYIADFIRKSNSPRVDTFSRIADVCGYDLILLPRNQDAEFIVIDADEMQP